MVRIRQRWSIAMLGIVVGLGLVACKKDAGTAGDQSGESGAGASGDLSLLPADSEVVFGMNLGQMQQSGLWKQFVEPKLAAGKGQRAIADFKAKCGTDPMKMISSFTVGAKDLTGQKPSVVIIGHGLDKAKILDCIEKNKADITKDGGEITRDGDTMLFKDNKGEPGALLFTSDSTALLVIGPSGTAAGVKAVASGGSSLKNAATFLDMYKKVKSTDSIWGLASGKVMENLPLDMKATAAFGSINVTDGLALDVRVRFASADAATQAAGMANTQVKQATQYFDKAEVTSEGNELHASVSLSGQKLSQLIPLLSMFAGGIPGMGGN